MRRLTKLVALLGVLTTAMVGCGDAQAPINRVGVNVVEKSAFDGSWYMHRTVIGMEYEAAPLDYVGNNAGDGTAGFLGVTIPRVRWVIDENFLYAYRDYELTGDTEDVFRIAGEEDEDYLGQPVAAFAIESHFDIRRAYNTVTGEEQNVVMENTVDRHWYERDFMRVNWSQNLITGYFGNGHNLNEIFGAVRREPADLFVQDQSSFPASWRPQFHFMSCTGPDDTECARDDHDWATDYDENELYSMSFVTQEILSPGSIYECGRFECATVPIWVRTSFLRISDRRDYAPVSWDNDRFNRAGYFALSRATYDDSSDAGDPSYGTTDFVNNSANRHNIWSEWFRRDADNNIIEDANGNPEMLPYTERGIRPITWYTSVEVPGHLIKPSYELVGQWNEVFMNTVRQLRGQSSPTYPAISCQGDDPGAYCFCQTHPDTGEVINATCPGVYDPFENPTDAMARGVTDPFDCYVAAVDADGNASNALALEPDWNDAGIGESAFNPWFGTATQGGECVNVLRINTCNSTNTDEWDNLDCQERGDVRFKLLSLVDQPGTPFLGVAQMRGDPLTGEIITGDANIGGPAMNSQRTFAMQTYDLMNGDLSDQEFYTGEDVRAYLNAVDHVELPAPPSIDFSASGRLGLTGDPAVSSAMGGVMGNAMNRAETLQGVNGRASIFSDRVGNLAGSEIERRLMNTTEGYALAHQDSIPQGFSATNMPEETIAAGSPFSADMMDRLDGAQDFQMRLSLSNMMMPNEYTDNSVLSFVMQHRDWSRVRVEFELNRRLYRDTQVHEMGHCLGLRHHFGGTADPVNYFDGYYTINERFPLPDPSTFDTDGDNRLDAAEQSTYRDAHDESRRLRELAGIDQWMNSSVMDYTPNWYQRINGAGRYDNMAISFGYGDVVDIYDNTQDAEGNARAPIALNEINPVNTMRASVKYYHGGETCQVDADCPFSAAGPRAAELLPNNTASGLVQTCIPNPTTPGHNYCTDFDDDAHQAAGNGSSWVPVDYFYCEDVRAGTRTLPGCATFDEGDSFREIVHNQTEAYERSYLFNAFRRYRSNFSIGGYFNRLVRVLDPMLGIYQNLIYRYSSDEEFRAQEGPFGFADEFLATADIMNLFARMLSQPSVGSYQWNAGWNRYELGSLDIQPNAQLVVPFGEGRYLNSIYQTGLTGLMRVERVGAIYDSILAMQFLTARGIGSLYGPDLVFLTNFYDLFPNEIQQIFTGMIAGRPEDYMPRVECDAGSTAPRCDNPRLVYMDFYRGDCSTDPATGVADPLTCRPSPDVTYRDLSVVNGGTRTFLQTFAAIYALSSFPIYYDTTFQNQMFICVEGQGDCFAPGGDAVEGVDYVRHLSTRFGKTFLAWQVDPGEGTASQTSIAFSMVKEADDNDFIVNALRTYRGDFLPGDPPPSDSHLSPAQRTRLAAIGYGIPDDGQFNFEIDRLEERQRSLESIFFFLIQLEREYGITFPFPYNRDIGVDL